ncbi:acyl-CoA carboxylase epsilon subunit [Streptomyces sp. NPDC087917]|uniref:acyl-CoA carboxylase epsilon subunit n=1 Tax=unclassified Streptomyces TaxID=2593676 RepID=UPI00342924CD
MSIVEATPPENVRAPDTGRTPPPDRLRGALTADDRTALALAAIRITRGNPTAEEVAALAVLLAARIRPHPQESPPQTQARIHKLRRRPQPDFIAPGSWAS